MNIENVIHNENLTLKPLPLKILYCSVCKTDFISYLKLNAEFYKTCEECRNKIRLQGKKHRKNNKQFISDLK